MCKDVMRNFEFGILGRGNTTDTRLILHDMGQYRIMFNTDSLFCMGS